MDKIVYNTQISINLDSDVRASIYIAAPKMLALLDEIFAFFFEEGKEDDDFYYFNILKDKAEKFEIEPIIMIPGIIAESEGLP